MYRTCDKPVVPVYSNLIKYSMYELKHKGASLSVEAETLGCVADMEYCTGIQYGRNDRLSLLAAHMLSRLWVCAENVRSSHEILDLSRN